MKKLTSGKIKRLHVDKNLISSNIKNGTKFPVLTIQTSKGSVKAKTVNILGPSKFIYRPDKPLSCGARAWIETVSEVEYE